MTPSPPPTPDEAPARPRFPFFGIPPSPGVWLGILGMVLFLVAALLPWYSVSALFPSAGYNAWTIIIQFDGFNGLYVDPQVKARIGLGVTPVVFPVFILFVISAFRKIRKLIRSTTHKARSASMLRGSLNILIPVGITIGVITQFAAFIPGDAPPEAKDLGQAIASQPFGGQREFTFHDSLGLEHRGTLEWGFGPALWVMVAAAVIMNIGSQWEKRIAKKAFEQLSPQVTVE